MTSSSLRNFAEGGADRQRYGGEVYPFRDQARDARKAFPIGPGEVVELLRHLQEGASLLRDLEQIGSPTLGGRRFRVGDIVRG